MAKIENPYVICPFYHYDDSKQRITCEGITNHSNITQFFDKKIYFDNYMKKYCYRACTDCGIFKMIMELKYAEDDT